MTRVERGRGPARKPRWYDPAVGRWGGVDPLAEDYYSWGTANYVMGNPIRFIDPDGMSVDNVIITGSDAEKATEELNKSSSLSITRNSNTGMLSATGKPSNNADAMLLKAINSSTNHVTLNATDDVVTKVDGDGTFILGGAYHGSEVSSQYSVVNLPDGTPQIARSENIRGYQDVNMQVAGKMADLIGEELGQFITHEINEAFIGTQIDPGGNHASGYDKAHEAASKLDAHTSNLQFNRSKASGYTVMQARQIGTSKWTNLIQCDPRCRAVK